MPALAQLFWVADEVHFGTVDVLIGTGCAVPLKGNVSIYQSLKAKRFLF